MSVNQIKVTCGKCSGRGTFNCYRHIQGGECFACDGRGYILTTSAAIERKAKTAEARREDTVRAVEAGAVAGDAREALYQNDSRLGPDTLARCVKHPVAAFETYSTLAKIDAGEFSEETHPWIFRNLAE